MLQICFNPWVSLITIGSSRVEIPAKEQPCGKTNAGWHFIVSLKKVICWLVWWSFVFVYIHGYVVCHANLIPEPWLGTWQITHLRGLLEAKPSTLLMQTHMVVRRAIMDTAMTSSTFTRLSLSPEGSWLNKQISRPRGSTCRFCYVSFYHLLDLLAIGRPRLYFCASLEVWTKSWWWRGDSRFVRKSSWWPGQTSDTTLCNAFTSQSSDVFTSSPCGRRREQGDLADSTSN